MPGRHTLPTPMRVPAQGQAARLWHRIGPVGRLAIGLPATVIGFPLSVIALAWIVRGLDFAVAVVGVSTGWW